MPYKYVAKVGTIPFSDSSEPVRLALKKLNWASKKLLDENFTHEFNEVLALGYLPNQKIDVRLLSPSHAMFAHIH